jgi:hypothetical protein
LWRNPSQTVKPLAPKALVSAGGEVVVRLKARGTHAGEAFGLKGSHDKIEYSGMTGFRFRNGQIVEAWDRYNLGALAGCLATGAETQTVRCVRRQRSSRSLTACWLDSTCN